MSEPLLTIDADASGIIAAFRDYGLVADRLTKQASKITADRIASEYARRMTRRAVGATRRGQHTAETITVEDLGDRGYRVFAASPAMPNVPLWLEFGTVHMDAREALYPSARLEEQGHLRRVADALTDAAATTGLGE